MSLESRYELVLSRESSLAQAVANRVVDKPLMSAWMILIPIVFVQYLLSARELRDVAKVFVREFMLTKRLALEAALEMARGAMPKEDALAGQLSAEWGSEAEPAEKEIRAKQRAEIELLIDHFTRLLAADGDSYPALVRNAYRGRADYAAFLERLHRAESEINRAAVRAFATTEGFEETIAKTETVTRKLRWEETDALFGPGARDED